jgi:hypothetical protein
MKVALPVLCYHCLASMYRDYSTCRKTRYVFISDNLADLIPAHRNALESVLLHCYFGRSEEVVDDVVA